MRNIERHVKFVIITLIVVFIAIFAVTCVHEFGHNYDCMKLNGTPKTHITVFGIGSYATCLNVSHEMNSVYSEMGEIWDTSFLGRYGVVAIISIVMIPIYILTMRRFL